MSNLPDPPIPSEVDLSDYPRMPIDVVKLKESAFIVNATGDEFRAAVILWAVAWHQVPAGSLPSGDVELAYLAGYGRSLKEWLKVKEMALTKWILCSDGRFYHPLLVENALSAWEKKRKQIDKSVKGAMARWHQKNKASGNATGIASGNATGIASGNATGIASGNATGNAKPMPNECQERGEKEIKKKPPSGVKKKSPPLEKFATQWPKDFALTEALRAYALSKHIKNPDEVWEHFENHHRAKGSQFKDWSRAWYTWVQNQPRFGGVKNVANTRPRNLTFTEIDQQNQSRAIRQFLSIGENSLDQDVDHASILDCGEETSL